MASLHLHPERPGDPLKSVDTIEVVENQGIRGEPRYFGKVSRRTGKPARRQVSLIEREQIAEHAVSLGLQSIPPGAVRANIETLGVDLVAMVGSEIQIGEAILRFYEARTPCEKMNALCEGLRDLMESGRQGVLAEVVRSGRIQVGNAIRRTGKDRDSHPL